MREFVFFIKDSATIRITENISSVPLYAKEFFFSSLYFQTVSKNVGLTVVPRYLRVFYLLIHIASACLLDMFCKKKCRIMQFFVVLDVFLWLFHSLKK